MAREHNRRDGGSSEAHDLLAGLVLLAMIVGAALVWIGGPIAGMWLAGELTDEFGAHMPLALALVLPTVTLGSIGLAWLNALYLRLTESRERVPENLWKLRRRGPLEGILAVCFVVGVIALFIWFFAYAENPARGVF